jgi:hypothetical protein
MILLSVLQEFITEAQALAVLMKEELQPMGIGKRLKMRVSPENVHVQIMLGADENIFAINE